MYPIKLLSIPLVLGMLFMFGQPSVVSGATSETVDLLQPSVSLIPLQVGKPTLFTPSNGYVINQVRPTFEWYMVENATKYRIQIASTSDFNSIVEENDTLGTGEDSYLINTTLTEGIYFWRVAAGDDTGWGEWSDSWSVTIDTKPPVAPTLSAPTGLINVDQPTFSWSLPEDNLIYSLQVSNDGFSSFQVNETDLSTNSFTSPPSVLNDGTTYSWRVEAIDQAGNHSGWSEVWTVTIDTTPPNPPTLSMPSDKTLTNDNQPTFSWTAEENGLTYQLQINNDFMIVNTSSFIPSSELEDGSYSWQVRAKDAAGNWSDWSKNWQLEIDTTPPDPPVLDKPDNGDLTKNNYPIFKWNSSENKLTYHLQINGTDYLPLVSKSFTPASSFLDGSYSWKVKAKDEAGNWSEWSDTWTVTIDTTPPESYIVTPSGNVLSHTFAISWTGTDNVSGIGNFELQYDDNGEGWMDWGTYPSIGEKIYKGSRDSDDHTYCFRVRATDKAENSEGEDADEDACFTVDLRPDLQISLELNRAAICKGDSVTVTTTLFNWGEEEILPSSNFLLLYKDIATGGYKSVTDNISAGLDFGESTTVTQVLTPEQVGSHRIEGIVDSDNSIVEFSEDNNDDFATLNVVEDRPPFGSLTVNGGVLYTNDPQVQLDLQAKDRLGCASENLYMNLFYNHREYGWESYKQRKQINLTEGDGTYEIKVRYKDERDHTSEVYTQTLVLDTISPTATTNPLAPEQAQTQFDVSWKGIDDIGIECYEVQVKDGEAGSWTIWQVCTTATQATYIGSDAHTYYFRTRALDLAGNWSIYSVSPEEDTLTTINIGKEEEKGGQIYIPLIIK